MPFSEEQIRDLIKGIRELQGEVLALKRKRTEEGMRNALKHFRDNGSSCNGTYWKTIADFDESDLQMQADMEEWLKAMQFFMRTHGKNLNDENKVLMVTGKLQGQAQKLVGYECNSYDEIVVILKGRWGSKVMGIALHFDLLKKQIEGSGTMADYVAFNGVGKHALQLQPAPQLKLQTPQETYAAARQEQQKSTGTALQTANKNWHDKKAAAKPKKEH
ncbi:hypothetical protein HKX48_002948, partial [Thoreauomyces humboldtii]